MYESVLVKWELEELRGEPLHMEDEDHDDHDDHRRILEAEEHDDHDDHDDHVDEVFHEGEGGHKFPLPFLLF